MDKFEWEQTSSSITYQIIYSGSATVVAPQVWIKQVS